MNYVYYKLQLKLLSPMLGTCTEVSIYHEHVLQKAKKEIEKANRLGSKITKAIAKYKGENISEEKEVLELQAVLRAYCQLLGKQIDMPTSVEEILKTAESFKEDLDQALADGEVTRATVFAKDTDGLPLVSTHMILGNFKENLKIIVNSGNKEIIKSKAAVSEALALDIKFVENFMKPSSDILKGDQEFANQLPPTGRGRWLAEAAGRIVLERPIKFERMGKVETAIAMSEALPAGTEMTCTVRLRQGSAIDTKALELLLDMGKNNGLGAWRGSGNMGSYLYKLEELVGFKEERNDGWK